MTRRAGGWILGLVVIVGMAAAGVVGLGPILLRKTAIIEIVDYDGLTPQREAGVRLAFSERDFRAGPLRVQPSFVNKIATGKARVSILRSGDFWEVHFNPPAPPLGLPAHPTTVGGRAAHWARRAGMTRVFVVLGGPNSAFTDGVREEAASAQIQCVSLVINPEGKSLVDAVLEARSELVILSVVEAPGMIDALRKSGYSGRFLVVDPYIALTPVAPSDAALDGAYLASPFPPVPASFAATPRNPGEYFGYRLALLLLDAIDQVGTDDPVKVRKALAESPEFASGKGSALPGAVYLIKNRALQLVEPLK